MIVMLYINLLHVIKVILHLKKENNNKKQQKRCSYKFRKASSYKLGGRLKTLKNHKGVNQCSKDVTQKQQQRPESLTVTFTWHASNYKVHKLYQKYILISGEKQL